MTRIRVESAEDRLAREEAAGRSPAELKTERLAVASYELEQLIARDEQDQERREDETLAWDAEHERRYQRDPRGYTLGALESAVERRDEVQRHVDEAVADARDEGASWSEIARVLHVSKQAAQQKYGKAGER